MPRIFSELNASRISAFIVGEDLVDLSALRLDLVAHDLAEFGAMTPMCRLSLAGRALSHGAFPALAPASPPTETGSTFSRRMASQGIGRDEAIPRRRRLSGTSGQSVP